MKGLKAVLVVGVVLVGLLTPYTAQAHNMDISFEPENPGSCTSKDSNGGKCAAGGGY